MRAERGVLICVTRHGFVCANAGVDASNAAAPGELVLLPEDPDASARSLRAGIDARARGAAGGDRGRLVRPRVADRPDRRGHRRGGLSVGRRLARPPRPRAAASCARPRSPRATRSPARPTWRAPRTPTCPPCSSAASSTGHPRRRARARGPCDARPRRICFADAGGRARGPLQPRPRSTACRASGRDAPGPCIARASCSASGGLTSSWPPAVDHGPAPRGAAARSSDERRRASISRGEVDEVAWRSSRTCGAWLQRRGRRGRFSRRAAASLRELPRARSRGLAPAADDALRRRGGSDWAFYEPMGLRWLTGRPRRAWAAELVDERQRGAVDRPLRRRRACRCRFPAGRACRPPSRADAGARAAGVRRRRSDGGVASSGGRASGRWRMTLATERSPAVPARGRATRSPRGRCR